MDYNYSIEHEAFGLVTFLNQNHIRPENIIAIFKDADNWYVIIYKI